MSFFPSEPTNLIRPLHVWQLGKKPWIQRGFWLGYAAVLATIPFGISVFSRTPQEYALFAELGRKFGTLAALTYSLSLLPGTLKRLQIWPMTMVILNTWRRQFGVLTFFLVLAHQSLVRSIPLYFINPDLLQTLGTQEAFGFYAYLIFFVLWLTSSDWTKGKMGSWWKRLHNLTHIAVWLVFFHVLFTTELPVKILVGLILSADVLSWVISGRRSRLEVPPAATPVG